MSRKFGRKLTAEELAGKIVEAIKTHSEFDYEELKDSLDEGESVLAPTAPAMDFLAQANKGCVVRGLLSRLTPTVEKDLAKVEFDTENVEFEEGEGYAEGETGFRTLPNGLTILGVTAGGDWEAPLYFCIYSDGSKLRGYVPTDGNPWNTKTKQAYGNDEEADEKNCEERFGVKDHHEVDIRQRLVDEDIQARIVYSGAAT